ncbi:adenylate/guanylate cyclase domain-containing protein [Oceanospirillum sediminis]|uniref:Adenylate/guanylate cyclase domain-containing protein n=1 Tax=Oceanospirillum sediminis TaxID=2760088 RepID=A0A839IWE0_9GAMM|nr:adenylate/guanylate cyclase domain-containing protein [Oceanospirillum sediminis]MBB1488769.1 adenylate/guanylate cyclase domain-containing protein [Oceanospirillum sediminis]
MYNSIHFPIANIMLELLLEGFTDYLREIDFYAMLLACIIQAWWLGGCHYRGCPAPLPGNLIAPAIYSVIEWVVEGQEFWSAPHHQAFWFFALLIGTLQHIQLMRVGKARLYLLLAEHSVRTSILLVMYAIFEWHMSSDSFSLETFLSESGHQFVVMTVLLLGLVVGYGFWLAQGYLLQLRSMADQLKCYSEWFLGRELLEKAVNDADALSLSRRQRAVLFMDIRGFTAWSEHQTPEQVVEMLNACFAMSEPVLEHYRSIRTKHTGDEIMAVFAGPEQAVCAAQLLRSELKKILLPYDLNAGCGIHYGELVEGLIGSHSVRSYDVVGDTVNTAKRLCDAASGGEILISQPVLDSLRMEKVFSVRQILMKGKQQAFTVFSL